MERKDEKGDAFGVPLYAQLWRSLTRLHSSSKSLNRVQKLDNSVRFFFGLRLPISERCGSDPLREQARQGCPGKAFRRCHA